MPLLELDLTLNDAVIPTLGLFYMLLSSIVLGRQIETIRKTRTEIEENYQQSKETRVEPSSKKMLQVDVRVGKVKP